MSYGIYKTAKREKSDRKSERKRLTMRQTHSVSLYDICLRMLSQQDTQVFV